MRSDEIDRADDGQIQRPVIVKRRRKVSLGRIQVLGDYPVPGLIRVQTLVTSLAGHAPADAQKPNA